MDIINTDVLRLNLGFIEAAQIEHYVSCAMTIQAVRSIFALCLPDIISTTPPLLGI
jgi:hypothetical protein